MECGMLRDEIWLRIRAPETRRRKIPVLLRGENDRHAFQRDQNDRGRMSGTTINPAPKQAGAHKGVIGVRVVRGRPAFLPPNSDAMRVTKTD